jgi:hypothetical protein
MGLAWQQGPLAPGAIGHFLVRDPLPERLLYAEPLRRRMRVRFGGTWIADSDQVILLHEPAGPSRARPDRESARRRSQPHRRPGDASQAAMSPTSATRWRQRHQGTR